MFLQELSDLQKGHAHQRIQQHRQHGEREGGEQAADAGKPLRIASLARQLGMSVSGLHHHFKAATGMSPLQFQKHLRLQEARRLMLGEHLDAASAGYRVGYDDAAHFNREYKSLFGLPPMRDMERLRGTARETAAAG